MAHADSSSVPPNAPKSSSPGWNRFTFAPTAAMRPATLVAYAWSGFVPHRDFEEYGEGCRSFTRELTGDG